MVRRATPFTINYSVIGEEDVSHRMLGIADRAGNTRAVLQQIASMLRETEAELFDTAGHGKWAPLADSTIQSKAARGLDPRILHATLALRASLTEEGGDNIEVITNDELHFSTSVEYAGFHQTGTSRMPKRAPVDLSEAKTREFTRQVQRFLVGEDLANVAEAGGGDIPWGLA